MNDGTAGRGYMRGGWKRRVKKKAQGKAQKGEMGVMKVHGKSGE